MLKKIIVLVAVLLMVPPAFGGWSKVVNPQTDTVDWEKESNGKDWQTKGEVWNWPATYDFMPICDMKVEMDVGFWIKVVNCTNSTLKVKQYAINTYKGTKTCKGYANVATEWKAAFTADGISCKNTTALAKTKFTAEDGKAGFDIKVQLTLGEVDMSKLTPLVGGGKCTPVGTVRLSVRPDIRPNYFMSSCTGDTYPTVTSEAPW